MAIQIGIDVGTTSVKGLAVSPSGEVVARAQAGYPLSSPHPGWSEQDPENWWRAAEAVLAELTQAQSEVAGIGLSGQMHGLVCLDAADHVLRPAILWNDQRTAQECAELEARVGLERLISLTGNRALTGYTAPKLLWLRRHEPHVYEQIAHILLPKDYVRLRLTGERAIDVADASGTLLFDVARRRWSEEVAAALSIPDTWLPRALESPEVSGRTRNGVPVAAGAGDQAAAALGIGVDRPGPLSVVLGTSGVVFAALPGFAADPEARLQSFCHAVPGGWHAMGVTLSAAGSLQWFRDTLAPGVPFPELEQEAKRWQPGCEGLTFLPYLTGERSPYADPLARGAFVGLASRHDRGALTRALMEGVAYGLRDSLDLLANLGVRATTGRLTGGGARSRLWSEVLAAVLGVPLELTAVEEGSAYGAAILGGVAGGLYATVGQAVDATVRVRSTVEPDRDWMARYAEGHERFRTLYPALSPYFQEAGRDGPE
ncbi:MAG: xylulokinase [Candidatus Dormibacteraeota bacterium]|nr:xylulokinase [Candidatus Dormibacteraeota bacterium]